MEMLNFIYTDITDGTRKFITSTIHVSNSFAVTNISCTIECLSNYDITDGSYVIIDATAPLLSLIGQDGAIVPRGSDFEYLGAVASDASYDLDIIVNSTGTIDTDNIGT